jgi:RimJ/RimL family protein N-acetyltransferase
VTNIIRQPQSLNFVQASADEMEDLALFLSSDSWPFHGTAHLDPEKARRMVNREGYFGADVELFWVCLDNTERVGIIRLFDLEDYTPMFDLRILGKYRGRGFGKKCVKWLTDYIFAKWPEKGRIEGHTRVDNIAMQRAFIECGYVKEAHHRQAWPDETGARHDSIGYAILRSDWQQEGGHPCPRSDISRLHPAGPSPCQHQTG